MDRQLMLTSEREVAMKAARNAANVVRVGQKW